MSCLVALEVTDEVPLDAGEGSDLVSRLLDAVLPKDVEASLNRGPQPLNGDRLGDGDQPDG